ncbi:MAG: hypothetical protein F2646_07190, partial [Actinobacteria bacterium]|nr:hypothetical protein [Actinomycetota bacterium]
MGDLRVGDLGSADPCVDGRSRPYHWTGDLNATDHQMDGPNEADHQRDDPNEADHQRDDPNEADHQRDDPNEA